LEAPLTASVSQPSPTTPLLEGRAISKSFGGLAALTGVDVAVQSGELVGIVGPNGSGKTTLFNCLTRMEKLTAGQIFFRGEDITNRKPFQVARMGLARTFQTIRAYPKLTATENMLLSRQWGGQRWWDRLRSSPAGAVERSDELLDFLTLYEQRDEEAGSLSVGQQRLLEIGMALMSNPDLILLDEATAGVNPALVDAIRDRIIRLNADLGKTILMIEHNIELVVELCSRVIVLEHGQVLAEGDPTAVLEDAAVVEAYFGRSGHDG
jgi:ABC-type branched-subunit amino acid transport system ATPase component